METMCCHSCVVVISQDPLSSIHHCSGVMKISGCMLPLPTFSYKPFFGFGVHEAEILFSSP
jgi:hypothetical protein